MLMITHKKRLNYIIKPFLEYTNKGRIITMCFNNPHSDDLKIICFFNRIAYYERCYLTPRIISIYFMKH